ncbi:kti12, chromatin associated [Rhizoclosmatium sp. JEL0117]|nr:kti12, chromatin associated [Rhizoclosmatium sp. JEL0117]
MPPKKASGGKAKETEAPPAKVGTYIFPDTSRYEGAYKDAEAGQPIMRHGEGKHICPDYVYNGNWEMDKMNGRGRLEFTSGAVYDGYWKDNKFMGQGTYSWPDGSQLTAEWERTRVNGPGKFTDKDGQNWIGMFSRGYGASLSAEIQ